MMNAQEFGKPRLSAWGKVLRAAVAACFLGTLLGFVSGKLWLGDLASHFRVQYAIVLALAGGAQLIRRHHKAAAACLTLGIVNALFVLPLYLPAGAPAAGGASLRIAQFNVAADNRRMDAIGRYLKESAADMILLEEVDARWLEALRPHLENEYPEAVAEPRDDYYGIALLSRVPLDRKDIIQVSEESIPVVRVELSLAGRPIVLYGIHPPPPTSPWQQRARDRQLSGLANRVRGEKNPVIVAGDFNATSWSAAFDTFVKATGLIDTRNGRGVQPTWPGFLPAPLRVTIDHVVVSGELGVRSRRIGPALGSDHRPVIVDLAWR